MTEICVVIASVNGLPTIGECLTSLTQQEGNFKSQIVVVNCCPDGTAEHIRRHFPQVLLVEAPAKLGIPGLRAVGMSQTKADLIAVTEDHCIAPKNWLEDMVQAHKSDYAAVGGTIVNGSPRWLMDWAVYLCEYSHVMPPVPAGEAEGVPGNNVSYKREWLEKVDPAIKHGYWEFFLHQELKRLGARFLLVPSIVLSHKKEFGFAYFMAQRFHYSRSFAGMRRARVAPTKCVFYILTAPLLPALMLSRTARQVFAKKRHRKKFLLSLPLLVAFMVSYAVGEFVGYLAGAGNSLERVQ